MHSKGCVQPGEGPGPGQGTLGAPQGSLLPGERAELPGGAPVGAALVHRAGLLPMGSSLTNAQGVLRKASSLIFTSSLNRKEEIKSKKQG